MNIKELTQRKEVKEVLSRGHKACKGCGLSLGLKLVLKNFDPQKTALIIPASCGSVITSDFLFSAISCFFTNVPFAMAVPVAAGIRAGLRQEKDFQVLIWAGDGATFDIGLGKISGGAERNDDLIYICEDNEAYMNTGVQKSSATPYLARTTTTPHSKQELKKDIIKILTAHKIPYAATLNFGYPNDFLKKIETAKNMRGFRFLHLLVPCPTGWGFSPELTVKIARLAVQTNIFPLYEVFDGERYILNFENKNPKPVGEYLKLQKRFRHLTPKDEKRIQENVSQEIEKLKELASASKNIPGP